MAGMLWVIAAVMELASVVAYYVSGFGVAFVLLQIFVIVSFGLTLFQIRERGGREHTRRF